MKPANTIKPPEAKAQERQRWTRKGLRALKRSVRAQAYRNGGLSDKAADLGVERAITAQDKRARRAEKRAADAQRAEIGQMRAREILEGTHQ